MSLTITIPGAVDVTTGSTAPAVLTIGVGVPGAQGPQGPAGPGVPAGGTSGQFLQKTSGTDYATDWVTVNPFITAVTSPLSVTSGNLSVNLSSYLTTSAAASTYYLQTNPAGYITSSALVPYLLSSTAASTYQPISGMSSYLTTSAAASTYAVTARGLPSAGTTGQVLTKNSGSDYDVSFATLIPGDRYLTTSTTSNTIGNGTKTFTVGTGLSYSSQQDVVISFDASNHMHALVTSYNSGTGVLVVEVQHHTGSGTYSVWTVNVGGTTPQASIVWGDITGTLGNQTDLSTALNAKLDSTTAASTYAPIASPTFTGTVTIPSGASISGFAPLESPALTGNVTIASNSTGAALFIEQLGTGNILTLHDQATDTSFIAIDANGKINTVPSDATIGAGFNVPHGTAPTSPVNGDIWTTTTGLFMRQNGSTQQYVSTGETQTISGNKTFSNATNTFGSSTATGTIGLATGATLSGSTKTVNIATSGVSGSTTLTTIGPVAGASTTTIGATTAASTLNLATGATLTATTKAVNIGTAGVSGSTTNITIGTNSGGTNAVTVHGPTTINGNLTTTGTTTEIANSTAAQTINIGSGNTASGSTKTIGIGNFGASGSTTNVNIGTGIGAPSGVGNITIGTNAFSTTTLNGSTNGVTLAADTNTTGLATTAYVVGQAGSATPLVNGTAAVGTSLRYARQDHVHPTDTSRAALASPTFTGVPAAPTAAVDTNTTQLATTAFVVAQASSATPLVDGTAAVGTSLRYARADHVHPTDTTRAPLASPAFTGTPSLPTGTTAVTQAAGNNTTAVATTAFVQQEVPAASTTAAGKVELATRLEVVEPSSSTLAVSPMRVLDVVMSPGYVQIAQNNGNVSTGTVGTGAGVFTTSMTRVCLGPNASVAGSSYYRPQTNGGVAQFYAKGINNASINFSKPFWMSGRSSYDDTHRGDANNTSRVTVGKSGTTIGALTQKGIGWQKVGGLAPNFFLLAHNGTTLTSVDTNTSLNSLGITGGVPFDWSIYSDGSGNVTMFINDVQVATTSAGPTGYSLGSSVWQEEVDQSASAATRMYLTTFGGHYYHA